MYWGNKMLMQGGPASNLATVGCALCVMPQEQEWPLSDPCTVSA